MVAMSILTPSSPPLSQTQRFQYGGGMSSTRTLRVVAAASPALSHAPRLLYAGEVGATSSLRVAAAASPALLHVRRLPYAGEIGATRSLRVVAAASPALPLARRLHDAGQIGAISPLCVAAPASPAVDRPLRLLTAVFLYPGSSARSTATAPTLHAHCLPPRQVEGTEDLPTPAQSPATPEMPGWGKLILDVSSATTTRRFLHVLAVGLLSGVRSTEFKQFVDWAAARFQLPQKLRAAILLGATVITVLFDAAVLGKDINDVCSYLLTHGPKSSSSTSD